MSITQRFTARRVRAALVTTVAAGVGVGSLLGMSGAASASTGHVDGYAVYTTCTGVSGQISYSPGLKKTKRLVHAVLTGTTTGCSNIFDGGLSGNGTITAVMSGEAKVGAEDFSGTFTVNWPASSGYNPSNGNLSVTESSGLETVSGTVTSGFETGAEFTMQYVITGHTGKPKSRKGVTGQTYVNTQPLDLLVNTG